MDCALSRTGGTRLWEGFAAVLPTPRLKAATPDEMHKEMSRALPGGGPGAARPQAVRKEKH